MNEFTERELILLDTALTDFINQRKKNHDNGLKPYNEVQKKIGSMINDKI